MLWIFLWLLNFVITQHSPHFKPNRFGIVHLFEWKFLDIATECEQFLAPNSFGGVQISPVSENLLIRNRPWFERYQPMSYIILTRSGNEDDLLNMTKRCNKVGVRIYVDVVLNNMAANRKNMTGTGGSRANNRYFPSVPYYPNEFHKKCNIKNYFDAHEVRNCDLLSLPDLDHSIPSVQHKIANFLNHLIDLGVAGFRIDRCKHMWPNDLKKIYKRLRYLNTEFGFAAKSKPFLYQEVLDIWNEPISKIEYTSDGMVTEYLYSILLGSAFRGNQTVKSLKKLITTNGLLSSRDAIVFIDNHDNQRGHGAGGKLIVNYKNPKLYVMSNVFMLSFNFGLPVIMSSYEFDNANQGPPSDPDQQITSPQFNNYGNACTNLWICEHRWNPIVNMIKFAIIVRKEVLRNWISYSLYDQVSYCRGKKGFVAINNDKQMNFNKYIYVCLPEGVYCDVISGVKLNGKCTGKIIFVDRRRHANISITISDVYGVIAFHMNSIMNN